MLGDSSFVPPYALQLLHNTPPPIDLTHRMASLRYCSSLRHPSNTLYLILSHPRARHYSHHPTTPLGLHRHVLVTAL
jgi:hypothetical protein